MKEGSDFFSFSNEADYKFEKGERETFWRVR